METAVVDDRFRAMGSDIHVIVVGGTRDVLQLARDHIGQLERRWSRFLPDSEISLLNAEAGNPVVVTDDTFMLVERSVAAWRLTGGGFDPTLLDALRAAGYDRSFDDLLDTAEPAPLPVLSPMRPGPTDIVFDDGAITLPAGMGFDPGGIGKGLAADLVSALMINEGAAGVCVNMGGDLRVRGASPTGNGWTLAIDHPWCATPIALVGLWDGAVATSSVLRRVWEVGGQRRHHLLDPATGQPSTSDLALATVIAGDAWEAEVLAKAVLLRGTRYAFDLMDSATAALAVGHDGTVSASDGFAAFLGGEPLARRLVFDDAHRIDMKDEQ
ncbi:MAG: FAD:protein FMN transferase [Ilumatobacteraceae bacterium]